MRRRSLPPERWQGPTPQQWQLRLVAKAVLGEPLQLWEKVELAALLRLTNHKPQAPRRRTQATSRA